MFLNGSGKKISLAGVVLVSLMLSVLFTACDVGLGKMVNTEKPVISMPEDSIVPGSFLQGDVNCIELQVDQPFGIDKVFMNVWYIDPETGVEIEEPLLLTAHQYPPRPDWCPDSSRHIHNEGMWYVNLDTIGMPDGKIRAQVTAIDTSGKPSTTTDIIYSVKNTPPQIEMTIPVIKGDDFDDPDFTTYNHEHELIYVGFDLMGLATDDAGVKLGWPKIMFWPVTYSQLDVNGFPKSGTDFEKKWGIWRTMEIPNKRDALTATRIIWPMFELEKNSKPVSSLDRYGNTVSDEWKISNKRLSSGNYRFIIWTKDVLGNDYYYPNRTNNVMNWVPEDIKWIEINYQIPAGIPIVEIFDLKTPITDGIYNGKGNFTVEFGVISASPLASVKVLLSADKDCEDVIGEGDVDITHTEEGIYHFSKTFNENNLFSGLEEWRKTNSADYLYIHVKVTDDADKESPAAFRNFIFDDTKPSIDIIEPENQSEPVTGTVVIRGSADDNQRVDSLYYVLGKTEAAITGDNLNSPYWINTGLGTDSHTIKHPSVGHTGYFDINIAGKANNAVWSRTFSNWNWSFEDITVLTKDAVKGAGNYYVTDAGDGTENLWKLPISFKITDTAGNTAIKHIELIIDPDADAPKITINSHATDGEIVGGTVRINGTASDNEWVYGVEIRITRQKDTDAIHGNPISVSHPGEVLTKQGENIVFVPNVNLENDGFMPVDGIGTPSANRSWYHTLNELDELTFEGGKREVLIEVRAIDAYNFSTSSPKHKGAPVKRTLSFDSGLPTIKVDKIIYGNYNQYSSATPEMKLKMESDYEPGMTWVSGFVTLRAVIKDDHKVTSIRLRNWHLANQLSPINYIDSKTPGVNQPFVVHNGIVDGKDEYIMYIPLDTNGTFLGGEYKNKANTYSLDIEALDDTTPVPYKGQSTVSIIIDNIFPSMDFIQPEGFGTTNPPEVTSTVIIRGSALDNQAVSKLYYALGKTETGNPNLGTAWDDDTGWTDTGLGGTLKKSHALPGYSDVDAEWKGELSSWRWEFKDIAELVEKDAGNYFVTSYGNIIENLWLLPIKFKIVDKARNSEIVNASMIIDPGADLPVVKITSHTNPEDKIVGGAVRITGTAADNEWVRGVWIKIVKAPDGLPITLDGNGNATNGTVVTASMAGQVEGFIPIQTITALGSNVTWSHQINADNELIYANGKREVLVQVRAEDSYISSKNTFKQYGNSENLLLTFDSGVPTIEIEGIIQGTYSQYNAASAADKIKMESSYAPGSLISGTVTLRVRIKDDNQITSIKLQNWGNFGASSSEWSSDYRFSKNPSDITPFVVEISDSDYEMFIPVATGIRNGTYKLDIEAKDNTAPSPYRTQVPLSFIMDNTKPSIQFIQPSKLEEYKGQSDLITLTSTVTFRGSAHDTQQIKSFHYALGTTETKNPSLGTTYDDHTGWTDTKLKATETTGLPTNHSPIGGPTIIAEWGGMFPAWSWKFNEISDVCIGSIGSTGNYYVESYDAAKNLWMLPVKFKLVDEAKNVNIIEIRIIVDPDSDRPRVEITQPDGEKKVGGTVRINGEARDNDWINTVEIRVSYLDGVVWKPALGYYDEGLSNPTMNDIRFRRVNHNFGTDNNPDIRGTMSEGATVTWQHTINSKGDLTPLGTDDRHVRVEVQAGDAYLSNTSELKQYGSITSLDLYFDPGVPVISIYVFDEKKDLPANTSTSGITENSEGAITVDGITIAKNDPTISPRVKEELTLWVKITDNSGIATVRLKNLDGSGKWSSNYITDIRTSPPSAGNSDPYIIKAPNVGAGINERTVYWMYIPLDTNRPDSSQHNTSHTYNMEIEVVDDSQIQFTAQQSISLEIDNFHPLSKFNSGLTAVARGTVANPTYNFDISGVAWDTAQSWTKFGGIERVVVYFSTVPTSPASGPFGTPISLAGAESTTADPAWLWNTQRARRNRLGKEPTPQQQSQLTDEGEESKVLPFFPKLSALNLGSPYYVSNNYAIVIDESSQSRGPKTIIRGSNSYLYTTVFPDAAVKEWGINLDARCLPDGQYMLHYVVFDTAENATHYSEKVTIANNRPILGNIVLGTDVDGNGSITAGTETVTKTVSSSGNTDIETDFRIRNSRFSINLGSSTTGGLTGGNGPTHYRLSYVTRDAAVKEILEKGQVYTIAVAGDEKWLNYGVFDHTSDYKGITFVALDNVTLTSGSVYSYTTPSQVLQTTDGSVITINNFSSIPDSIKTGGIISTPNDRIFIIKVWDSPESGDEKDALAHAAVLKVSVDNNDTLDPQVHIAALGKKYDNPINTKYALRTESTENVPYSEYNQNIVTTSDNKRKGYLQYGTRDVSGMVIFKGKAHDNVRVQYITAHIPGYTPATGADIPTVTGLSTDEFIIAHWDSTANRVLPARSGYTIEAMRADTNTHHWGFDAPYSTTAADSEHRITMDDAHVLNWNFAFDTSQIASVAADNVTITFRVRDASNPAETTANTGRWSTPVTTNVNIVPYITEVVTPLSDAMSSNKSAFNRSANGWYPVRENDNIEVKGFNFNGTSTHILVGGTRFTPTVVGSNTRTHLSFNIGTAAVSGALKVNVGGTASGTGNNTVTGGIDSINNSNNEEARYNMEPNGLNNNILTDNRYIYVWQTGYLLDNAVIQSPYMRVHSNSRWFLTYGTHTGATGYLNVIRDTGSAVTNQQIQNDTNRYLNMRMALDSAGDWFIGASNQTATANQTYAMHARGPTYSSDTNTTNANNVSNGSNHRRLIALNGISSKVRFPSIATLNTNSGSSGSEAAATKVITSYYDATGNDNAVIMHYGLIGGGSTLGIASGFGGDFPTNGAGGNRAYNTQRSFFARAQIVADNTTDHQGSMYTAAGVLSNGLPVVAWYDRTNQRLVFSYGSGPTTSNALNDSYFVKAVNGNNFSLNTDNTNTTANNNGQNISGGQNITIMRPIRPTAVNANNGTTYTFADGVSFEDNELVTIYFTNSNGTTTRYDNHYARVISATNRQYSFAEQFGSGTYLNFQNAADHHQRLSVYSARQGVTTTAVVTGTNYQYTLANHGLSASTYPFSFTNIATVTAGGTTGNASQADINTALNTIVNHVNNTFGVSVAAATMNATVNAANVGTAINAVINNIRSALGITIATVANPTDAARANVNTRLATAVANINNAIGYTNLTYTNLTSTAGTNSATNVTTGTASTTAVTQALVNAALNTIVNHVNNTFGVSVAAAAMSTTINVANIGTAINAVINNINTALGTSIATVDNPGSTGRTDVNTRLTTVVTNLNTALTALTTTMQFNNANRVLVRNNIVSTPTGSSGQAGTWQGNAVVLHEFAGTHVDMVVDAIDNIHLAYYDVFNGGLYYARITKTGTGYNMHPNTSNGIQIARVDTYLSAGTKIMLNVRQETHGAITSYVPYISYLHASFAETRNSVRVAWLRPDKDGAITVRHGTYGRRTSSYFVDDGHNSPSTDHPEDSFTGAWEVMTVPTQTVPLSDEFVCNGVPASGNFRSNGGLAAYTGMASTIIMSYMTDTHYEGAILKDNIINKNMIP